MDSKDTKSDPAVDIIAPVATTIENADIPAIEKRQDVVELIQAIGGHNISFTVEQEKRVLRKIDSRVLPIMLGAYFLQQLDKSALSYSSVFGIQADVGLHGLQYSWLGSILYVAQLVMQPLGAVFLVKFPLGKLISIAIFCWAISLGGMAGSRSFGALLATRFVLGSFESLIAPSLTAVTQLWWRRSEQTNRMMFWSAMNGVAFIVGSLSTYGIGHIYSPHLFSYQIIFLFCGCLTLVFAVAAFFLMPDDPLTAKFWDEGEDLIAIERLRANQMGVLSSKWRWSHALETIIDLKTWCWVVLVLTIAIPSGGIGTFGPLIVQTFGFDKFHTILFNTPFGAVQICATLGGGWLATRLKRKGIVIFLLALPCILGCCIILKVPRIPANKGVLLFAYYLLSFTSGITPLVWTWSAQNTAGDTKRKCTSAVVFAANAAGNIIGPLLYSADQAPLYHPGLVKDMGMFCLLAVLALVIPFYLGFLNKRHAVMRERVGKSAILVDASMMTKKEIAKGGKEETVHVEIEDRGLNDVTDSKNEDFIYVY